jgi:hypothetical protein
MTPTITLSSPKGGQGTTVTAAGLALTLANGGHVVATRSTAPHDLAKLVPDSIGPGPFDAVDLTVVDGGLESEDTPTGPADLRLLVLRPCYLALSRACPLAAMWDGVVVIEEPDRVLDRYDIEMALGLPVVATVPWLPSVARAIDAGLDHAHRSRGDAYADLARYVRNHLLAATHTAEVTR